MTAYNPPPRRRLIVDLGDAHDMDGLFDSIAGAVKSVSAAVQTGEKLVNTGTKIANTVSNTAQRLQTSAAPAMAAARQVAGGGRAAHRPAPRPAPVRAAAPMTISRSHTATRMRPPSIAPLMRTMSAEAPPAEEPAKASNAIPIAIGAVLVAAAGGGAFWFFTRKDDGRAPDR